MKLIVVKSTGIIVPKDISNRFDNLYFPIPYFNIKNGNTSLKYSKAGLSDDYKIYLLDSKSGKYWDGLKSKDYMPDGWENGYSKGVCINEKEKTIIYWFVVW